MDNLQEHPFPTYSLSKKDLLFALGTLIIGLLLANVVIFGGFHLGFAVAATLTVLIATVYLLCSGCKPKGYALTLLGLSAVIAASFARSDDGFVKFVMLCFLVTGTNLGLCLLAGKNRRDPGKLSSLADAGHTLFRLGVGELSPSIRGLGAAFRKSGTAGQKIGSVLLGLGIALPVLLLIVPLLMFADAAFEGLMDRLPAISFREIIVTVLFGVCGAFVLFTRGAALRHSQVRALPQKTPKGLPTLTVNTLLGCVCFVYCVYLASQLAYFVGGFSGILPGEYTLAEYARRGFFEMAVLCGINLSVMILCLSLCRKEGAAPLSTRLLCLFLGIVTLFMVTAASAKMILYIDGYGLTRLRVLTQVIMVFMGLVTILVGIWLFVPRFGYMKTVLIAAMVIGAAVSWTDVDTQVARYNAEAYLSGRMAEIDMAHMGSLGEGALPYIQRVSMEARDSMVRQMAQDLITHHDYEEPEDWRSWNYVNHNAQKFAPAEKVHQGIAAEHYSDQEDRSLYLIVGMDGVSEIEVSTPYSSGGCMNADGSLLKKGEKLWLEQVESLRGVSITAWDKYGQVLWSVSFPEDAQPEDFLVMDDWIITIE